jgi:prephenate dehydrogenase
MAAVGRLAVVGTGLIGGSFALAARRAGLVDEVVGFGRRREHLELARSRGVIDRIAATLADAAEADVILLAAPVGVCAELARGLRPHAPAAAVLTDAGSVKARLVGDLEAAWGGGERVVGAHPIAGSEQTSVAAAQADLFVGRRCVLTPTRATGAAALALVRGLWEGVGAVVEEMDAAYHDALLARVSHAPHVIAYALVDAVGGWTHGADALAHAGSGFADTTRIAGSAAELWRDIVLANAPAVRAALAEFRTALGAFDDAVARGDAAALDDLMERARRTRARVGGGS